MALDYIEKALVQLEHLTSTLQRSASGAGKLGSRSRRLVMSRGLVIKLYLGHGVA
jgi:hypothetical protein